MRVYVASSWRNELQPDVVEALRRAGHEVYDFKNPGEGHAGFAWRDLGPAAPGGQELGRRSWTGQELKRALADPRSREGFGLDLAAMEWADVCVMVLPCGKSAHLELGWFSGQARHCYVLQMTAEEPELMYLLADGICTSVDQVLARLREVQGNA